MSGQETPIFTRTFDLLTWLLRAGLGQPRPVWEYGGPAQGGFQAIFETSPKE